MLTIYRASAGAGKTHKLTGEYLTLLFAHPTAYRRILAVTFTNKATDEMKGRIVQELYRLAAGRPSDYVASLSAAYAIDEDGVRARARSVLIAILHDYSTFNISTIDRFFQQTMRAFTREIGLQGGYGIEMDQELVLGEAVDRLLAELDRPENKDLLGWLLRFAEDKIEEGGGWNLRRDILSLGRELFKESYKAFSDAVDADIANKQALSDYKDCLFALIRSVEAEVRRLGEEGLALIQQFGLKPEDFKGGSRSPLLYLARWAAGEMKEPTSSFIALVDNPDGYVTKSMDAARRQIIGCVYEEGLNDLVRRIAMRFADLTNYRTAKEIVRYYYTLGILTDLSRQIAVYREEKNIMLIADTTDLLRRVIDGSDAPFIYEKTGTYVDHYMIDEFQDTSGMQWENFRPLVAESLAHERSNLIVGDVKQSIYRFRNSDWRLLDGQVRSDLGEYQTCEETLRDNWRSCRRIVEFNNAFFTAAPAVLQELYNEALAVSSLNEEERGDLGVRIMRAYDHCFQCVPPPFREKEGHVRIEFLETDDGADWRQEAMERLPRIIECLQDNGYAPCDIAILTRTNQEGAVVADTLLAYKEEHPSDRYRYDIISDDALFVSSSSAVRFLIAMLRHLRTPDDWTLRKMAGYALQALEGNFGEEELEDYFGKEPLELPRQSLYEATEALFRHFADSFPAEEQVFIQAFLDMVEEYAEKENADMGRFLAWWDETGCRRTIATPDTQNAIRVLTVHKSKGLGFKAVIVPFCDWEIDHKPLKPVVLWCHPDRAPFDRLRLVPVRYGQGLGGTIFARDYFDEKSRAFIDNLNTLYVAFTRSKEELIAFAPCPKKGKDGKAGKVSSIAGLLWAGTHTDIATTRTGDQLVSLSACFSDEHVFEMGNWWRPSPKKEENPVEEISMGRLCSIAPDDRLRLRLRGRDLSFDDTRRKHGALMHEILSRVRVWSDIPAAVESYRMAGVVDREEARALTERLGALSCVADSAWYDGSARVLNEVDILFDRGRSRRPDRVMIYPDGRVVVVDYKFGEREDKRYLSQVRDYLRLIGEMGYPSVEGYLWYVELGKITPVAR